MGNGGNIYWNLFQRQELVVQKHSCQVTGCHVCVFHRSPELVLMLKEVYGYCRIHQMVNFTFWHVW